MAYFFIQFLILVILILRYTINPWSMWYCYDSELLFKKMMIKPNSWMHHVFLNKNNFSSKPLHIWPLAIELIFGYITSFINIALGITIWILEALSKECLIFIIIYWIVLSIFFLGEIVLGIWLHKVSKSFFLEQMSFNQNQFEQLHKDIEEIYPYYFCEKSKK